VPSTISTSVLASIDITSCEPCLTVVRDSPPLGRSSGIVRSFRTLHLADVYAVISRYLANPLPFNDYLRQCDEQAAIVRRGIEASQPQGVS
jgi:hypothetical protein